jgi:hypothetical protein
MAKTDDVNDELTRPMAPRQSIDSLDVDELGSVQHCLAAIAAGTVTAPPAVGGNVESEK